MPYRSRSIVRRTIIEGEPNDDNDDKDDVDVDDDDDVDVEDCRSRRRRWTDCERCARTASKEERSAARPDVTEVSTRYISRKDGRGAFRSIVDSSIRGSIAVVVIVIVVHLLYYHSH